MMRQLRNSSAFALLAAFLLGCGGSSESSSPTPAGRYVGSWVDTDSDPGTTNDSGTIDLTIATDRLLSGSATSQLGGRFSGPGEAHGSITSGGKSIINGLWPSDTPGVPFVLGYEGRLKLQTDGVTLKGTLERGNGDIPVRSVWTLVRQ